MYTVIMSKRNIIIGVQWYMIVYDTVVRAKWKCSGREGQLMRSLTF